MSKVDSLDELATSFARWRKKKRYAREQVPEELLEHAHRAVRKHGLKAVLRVTKLNRSHLEKETKFEETHGEVVPSFSRLELSTPSMTDGPLAEIETAKGVKIRIFAQTKETLRLLSSLCGIGDTP